MPTLGDGSCSRNSENYFSDVTFNYFYSDSRKVSRIKADVLTPVKNEHRMTADVYNARLSCVLQWSALYRGGKLGTKTSSTDEADTAHMVARYRQLASPDTSFIPTSFESPQSLRPIRARDTAYLKSYATDVLITPCLSPCFVEGC